MVRNVIKTFISAIKVVNMFTNYLNCIDDKIPTTLVNNDNFYALSKPE